MHFTVPYCTSTVSAAQTNYLVTSYYNSSTPATAIPRPLSSSRQPWRWRMMAYLGPAGTYSHEAALECFPKEDLRPQDFLKDVVHSVYIGECEFGVLPIENSTNGAVFPALEALDRCPRVRILGDFHVPVLHNLYTFGHDQIERVYSHPQVWGQVEKFTSQNDWQLVSCSSTAAALQQAKEDPQGAAIASAHGGRVAGTKPTREAINDEQGNATRFVVLGQQQPQVRNTAIVVGGGAGRVIEDELDIREVAATEVPQGARIIGYSGKWVRDYAN